MGVFDKVRNWIDGDSSEKVLEQAAKDAQIKPRSVAEEFIVKLARGVEEVMQREMVPLPQGTTLIPTEYIIFLSDVDDKEWQGAKRRGLEQGLYHVLAERAKEISGKKKLETQSFAVELRVDGTLEKGDIRIQHSWEEASTGKTGVIARGKSQQPPPPVQPRIANQVIPMQNQLPVQNSPVVSAPPQQPPPTIAQNNFPAYQQPQNQEAEEATRVQKRQTELYKLEVWQGGVRQNVVQIFQNEVGIGRGSKSKPVDVPLTGDPEISRRHITIICNGNGNYWLVSEGRNATFVSNREVPMGQRVQVSAGEPITVCSYLLRIQPK
jgi:FHA domain